MKRYNRFAVLLVALLAVCMLFVACSNGNDEQLPVKDAYNVTYNLNYEGSSPRTVSVKHGTRTNAWRPSRSGYSLAGWYTDSACTDGNEFDFMTYIVKDTELWAKWNKNAEQYTVTFDYNYAGAGAPATISATENEKIDTSLVPTCPRLGMQYKGWYTDDKCTQEWNFASDTVNGEMTLYADYEYDATLPRDTDGNLVFENVSITVWSDSNADFGLKSKFMELANEFNEIYDGKITVTLTNASLGGGDSVQNMYCLRRQQVANVADTAGTYYSVSDVYALAGLEFDANEYYTNAINDCFVDGTPISVPVASSAPFLIYNKELMAKYNGEEAMPDNFTAFKELLIKAYNGERETKSQFKSIVTNTEWTFKECASYASYLQNDAPYFVLEDGKYVNKWGERGTDSFEKAVTAASNLYDLFGGAGAAKGGLASNSYDDAETRNAVKSGNALMGLINIGVNVSYVANDASIGIMPISGLFADQGNDGINSIPVQTVGLQFYKAKNVPLIDVAASALFADYVSKHSGVFADIGWHSVNKAVVQSDAYQNNASPIAQAMLKTGSPENFVTLPGCVTLKSIFNQTAAEGYIVNWFNLVEFSGNTVILQTQSLRDAIISNLP